MRCILNGMALKESSIHYDGRALEKRVGHATFTESAAGSKCRCGGFRRSPAHRCCPSTPAEIPRENSWPAGVTEIPTRTRNAGAGRKRKPLSSFHIRFTSLFPLCDRCTPPSRRASIMRVFCPLFF